MSRLNPCCNEVVLPLVPLFVSLVPFHPSPIIKVTLYTVLLPRQVLPHSLNLMVLLFQVLLQGFQVFQGFFFDVTLQYLEDSVSTDSLRDSVYLVPAPVIHAFKVFEHILQTDSKLHFLHTEKDNNKKAATASPIHLI